MCGFHPISDTQTPHSTQTKQFGILNPEQSLFSVAWYQNEISYQNGNFMRPGGRNELILEWPVGGWNIVSVSCKQIQRNLRRWNEFITEWKSFWYLVKRTLVCWPVRNIDVMLILIIKLLPMIWFCDKVSKKCMSPRQDFMWCMF